MPMDRLSAILSDHVTSLQDQGTAKGSEAVVREVIRATGNKGPRFLLKGEGDKQFVRMNANSYLGLSLREDVIRAGEEAAEAFGAGPGAVRFISGTYTPHVELERSLARFHNREAGMIFSAAYTAVVGILSSMITKETLVISDELNHNCIINAIRLSRPAAKGIYPHVDMAALDRSLEEGKGKASRALVVTDGIFSMRGDHAPLDEVMEIARRHDADYPENVVVVVDDSHGVGAFGATGRGTEEYTNAPPCDVLIGTLGKAFGVNGGYVVSSSALVSFLVETAPTYIYSNPITAGEAQAAIKALQILESDEGKGLLAHLRALTDRFQSGLVAQGFEVIPGAHPVVPLMVRDTGETRRLVAHLYRSGILATGLAFPVVPRGDDEIRFQINADHTVDDIDYVLSVLAQTKA